MRCLLVACMALLLGNQSVSACSFIVSNFNATQPDNGSTLKKANYFNQFRGPDATNVVYQSGWTFVHNLLWMTGVFTLQPFVSKDKAVAALFNGEIYNFPELSEELAGSANAFASDGYTLVPAYKKWGNRFVEHFEGEFAIVLVDFKEQQVVISADVFGTKPLWYARWPCNHLPDGLLCFAAASYQSVLTSLGAPEKTRRMADPNKTLFLSFKNGQFAEVIPSIPIFRFDLRQYKTTTDDWEKAFMQAVRLRTRGVRHNMFIGLSAGYDSGAIMLALQNAKLPFFAYNIATGGDAPVVIRQRIAFADFASSTIFQLDGKSFDVQHKWLEKRIEPFKYTQRVDHNMPLMQDRAATALSFILSHVRKRGGLIYLSGSGADEIISDYAMNGKPKYGHSCFSGVFPANLSTIFPWKTFYGDTMRDYLMKDELTGGAHGIETRYPFLDPRVVQEYLWLSHTLKNIEYKKPIADFFRRYKFPNMYGAKAGFSPRNFKDLNRVETIRKSLLVDIDSMAGAKKKFSPLNSKNLNQNETIQESHSPTVEVGNIVVAPLPIVSMSQTRLVKLPSVSTLWCAVCMVCFVFVAWIAQRRSSSLKLRRTA